MGADVGQRLIELADQALISHAVYSYLVTCVCSCSPSWHCLTLYAQQLGDCHDPRSETYMVPHRECFYGVCRDRRSCICAATNHVRSE